MNTSIIEEFFFFIYLVFEAFQLGRLMGGDKNNINIIYLYQYDTHITEYYTNNIFMPHGYHESRKQNKSMKHLHYNYSIPYRENRKLNKKER